MRLRSLAFLPVLLVVGRGAGVSAADPPAAPPATDPEVRRYNPETVEHLKGEVTRVAKVAYKGQPGYGVQLRLKTDKEVIQVRLGPGWWIDQQGVRLDPGDTIEVTGSRLTLNDKSFLVAAEVRKGDAVLHLRKEKGAPLWRQKDAPKHGD